MLESAITRSADAVRIKLHVRPGAKRNSFNGLFGDSIKLELQAPPVDGKANSALIKFISSTLGISKSSVSLIAGECCRDKVLEVRNCEYSAIIEKISQKNE